MKDLTPKLAPEQAYLATAGHEIRTPLNGILGTVSLLLETELSPAQRQYAEAIHQSSAQLIDMLNNMLDYARLEAGKVELDARPLDPEKLAREVVELLAPRAHRKGLDIAVSICPDVPEQVLADPAKIKQILFNLVGNALKFTDTGAVLVDINYTSNRLAFRIIDTGPGLTPEAKAGLFKRVRTSRVGRRKQG